MLILNQLGVGDGSMGISGGGALGEQSVGGLNGGGSGQRGRGRGGGSGRGGVSGRGGGSGDTYAHQVRRNLPLK